jgi:hypothetical protein
MPEADSHIFEDQAGFLVARVSNLAVIVWRETPTVDAAKVAFQYFGQFEQVPGRGFALITVITPNCAPVGPEVRQAFDTAMRSCRDSALGMAGVIEVQGVLGGLTRAIVRTMNIVSRAPYPVNTYATVKAASEWLPNIMSQRGSPTVKAEEIERFIDGHRRHQR